VKPSRIVSVLALAGLCATALAAPEAAGRFVMDVKIDGGGRLQDGAAQANVKVSQSARIAFSVSGSGQPGPINPLDMSAQADMVARQNAAQAQAAQANMPSQAKQMEIVQRAEKAAAACRNDVACLQRVAADVARQTASWHAAPVAAPQVDERYLTLQSANTNGCKAQYDVRIEDSVEGTANDVQGLVPFSRKAHAGSSGNAHALMQVCASGMIVHDLKTNKIWAATALPRVTGRAVATRNNRTSVDQRDAQLRLNDEAVKWINQQLMGAPRSGRQKTTLRYPSEQGITHKGEEVLDVEISWRFGDE